MITLKDAIQLSKRGNVIPVFTRIPADLYTPVLAYMSVAHTTSENFLLESVEGGEKLARYSFLGAEPYLIIEGARDSVTIIQGKKKKIVSGQPLEILHKFFFQYKPVAMEGLPRFTGGGVGYFSYETAALSEKLPITNPDSLGLPLFRFGLYNRLLIFDHLKQELIILANIITPTSQTDLTKQYKAAELWIKRIQKQLVTPKRIAEKKEISKSKIQPHIKRNAFVETVKKAQHYIHEGDIFQVVLSQRWHVDSKRNPLTVYRRLRRLNPSPYMFLLNFGDNSLVGASPEMMARVEHGEIETRPIAGTRKRGTNEAEDAAMIKELLKDAKELAEHTMLLDLGRNDIGRVSEPGSVIIQEQMKIEKYSHVIHIVSSVKGKLRRSIPSLSGHMACFPAGTVSGAPKIRAMEIINELESEQRGVYAGSVGYIDFWGNIDSCIAIRTLVKKKNRYFLQAGAGIVANSVPEKEFEETEAKARILVEAVTGE